MSEPIKVAPDLLQRYIKLRKTNTALFWLLFIITFGSIIPILAILILTIVVYKKILNPKASIIIATEGTTEATHGAGRRKFKRRMRRRR